MEKAQKAAKKSEVAKQHKSVESALFAFQTKKLVLSRNGVSKSNGKEYKYVTLDDLIDAVRPGLMEQGLLFTQLIQTDTMETKLIHAETGTSISSVINLGKPNNMQDYGARITYARRYALTAILGLNSEDDNDAALPPQNDPMQVNPAIGVKMPQGTSHSVQTSPVLVVNVPRVPEALKSEGYRKAKNAIDTAYSTEALEVIKGQIDRSQKLSAIEKDELSKDISAREIELGEVVRN